MLITSIAKKSARLSLVIGTILFLVAKLSNASDLIMIIGLFYVIIAFIVNSIILFILFLHLTIASPHHRPALIKAALLLLFNIPVAILYAWVLLALNHKLPL
ncbi:hypothetical protein [Pedobacter sp.]